MWHWLHHLNQLMASSDSLECEMLTRPFGSDSVRTTVPVRTGSCAQYYLYYVLHCGLEAKLGNKMEALFCIHLPLPHCSLISHRFRCFISLLFRHFRHVTRVVNGNHLSPIQLLVQSVAMCGAVEGLFPLCTLLCTEPIPGLSATMSKIDKVKHIERPNCHIINFFLVMYVMKTQ